MHLYKNQSADLSDWPAYSQMLTLQATLHLVLSGTVCFDRVLSVASPESFCSSYWPGWPETGNTVFSASGAACRMQGACCCKAKLWGYLSHATSGPTSTPSFFHQLPVQVPWPFSVTHLFKQIEIPTFRPFTLPQCFSFLSLFSKSITTTFLNRSYNWLSVTLCLFLSSSFHPPHVCWINNKWSERLGCDRLAASTLSGLLGRITQCSRSWCSSRFTVGQWSRGDT